MTDTVESTHTKISEKSSLVKLALIRLSEILPKCLEIRPKKKSEFESLSINLLIDTIDEIMTEYNLAVVNILGSYYENPGLKDTKRYNAVVSRENFVSRVHDVCVSARTVLDKMRGLVKNAAMSGDLDGITRIIERAKAINIVIALEKRNYEYCKCGLKMIVIPEASELRCDCGRVKTIIGAIFRDDQFYPQEGQKTKHGGYDTSRHYRFWMERLQAQENKSFDEEVMKSIEYVIKRDQYNKKTLSCEQIRQILKDPRVAATGLNDHAPLLVKLFGGPPPPQLDFQENRMISVRFNKAMKLYDIVNPEGGNKPYYPYFIYKIIENMFKDKPDKLRLLNYIHLQSRETIIKNDKFYEKICALADPEDGLVYKATDSASRY